ncbi:MAG TPA: WXG100 family type VII secretion target [Candidatus Dormibacteraeota bacterium]
MAFVGDAANLLLGGVPGDVHELFVVDVEPGDLARASSAMTDLGDTVRTVHVMLSDSVATLEGRWEGGGATAFQTEIWAPLNDGLGVLQRECHSAASQLANLAVQAEQAHLQKVFALNEEIQQQLQLTAVTLVTPGVGKAIAEVVGNVAERVGGELVIRVVAGIASAIDELIRKVLGGLRVVIYAHGITARSGSRCRVRRSRQFRCSGCPSGRKRCLAATGWRFAQVGSAQASRVARSGAPKHCQRALSPWRSDRKRRHR